MKIPRLISTFIFCATALIIRTANGQSAVKVVADPDLPQAFNPALATPMLENSPFTRSLNLSDSLVLTGMAYINGKPVATVLNKITKESYVISEVPNANGWKLSETNASATLTRAQAKIMMGAEIVTIRYSEEQMTPEAMKKGGFKPGGGDTQNGEDHPRRSFKGPSDEERQRFMNLSAEAKGHLIEKMHESREKLMNATPEERAAYQKKVFEKIEQADGKGPSQ